MNKKWSEKNTFEKTIDIISFVALAVWLICEMLERTNTLKCVEMVSYIAILMICVCEAISFWKVKRFISYIAIFGAVLIIAVIVLQTMVVTP